MGTVAFELSVVQDQDPVRMPDCGCTLGDQNHGHLSGKRRKCAPECQVCGIIQSTGRIIQDQYFRLFHQGAGNGEPLALAAGQIPAALFHMRIQPSVLATDNLGCLCGLKCTPELIIGCLLVAPAQVIPDGTLKQDCFLRYHGNLPDQRTFRIVAYIRAVHKHMAGRCIIEACKQLYDCRLAAAGTADDADGLTFQDSEIHVCQRFISGPGIGKGYMLKCHGRDIP